MKKIFSALLIIWSFFQGFAQVLEQEISLVDDGQKDEVYDNLNIDKKASFIGGEAALLKFYKENATIKVSNLKKPEESVYFNLFIDENGNVYDFKIISSFNKEHEKEACRLIHMMPKWLPGEHKGEKVKVAVVEYVTFD